MTRRQKRKRSEIKVLELTKNTNALVMQAGRIRFAKDNIKLKPWSAGMVRMY